MSEKHHPLWGTPAEEYRDLSRDCTSMGQPDLAAQFLALAEQEDRQAAALAALFGRPHP